MKMHGRNRALIIITAGRLPSEITVGIGARSAPLLRANIHGAVGELRRQILPRLYLCPSHDRPPGLVAHDGKSPVQHRGRARRLQPFPKGQKAVRFRLHTKLRRYPRQCRARFAELQRLFADEPGVAFVSFSVDPQTDTPERLGQFAQRWHADPERWYFLTGDTGKLDALIKNSFLLPITRDPMEAGKLLSQKLIHTNRFAIVDRSGIVAAYVDGLQPESVSVISRLVFEMLQESPSTKTSETSPIPRT